MAQAAKEEIRLERKSFLKQSVGAYELMSIAVQS